MLRFYRSRVCNDTRTESASGLRIAMIESNFADKTIWTGDNLEILRGMNSECVDLIYLDPPFNSN